MFWVAACGGGSCMFYSNIIMPRFAAWCTPHFDHVVVGCVQESVLCFVSSADIDTVVQ